jgi:hypothetical protein
MCSFNFLFEGGCVKFECFETSEFQIETELGNFGVDGGLLPFNGITH